MNWMENLLIIAGVSLDIFAAMECQGSLVAKINKKNLTVICGIAVSYTHLDVYKRQDRNCVARRYCRNRWQMSRRSPSCRIPW